MADEKPKTVKVEAIQPHSYNGTDYAVGDVYDIAEDLVESVATQGKAIRADAKKPPKADAKKNG